MSEELLSDEFLEEYWKMNFGALVSERDEARRWAQRMMTERDRAIDNNQSLTRMGNKMVLRIAKLSQDLEDALQLVESTREVMKDSEEQFSQWFGNISNKIKVARDERDEANRENAALRAEVERLKHMLPPPQTPYDGVVQIGHPLAKQGTDDQ